jgi:hypothetical protein
VASVSHSGRHQSTRPSVPTIVDLLTRAMYDKAAAGRRRKQTALDDCQRR